jgi:hypothetical protein
MYPRLGYAGESQAATEGLAASAVQPSKRFLQKKFDAAAGTCLSRLMGSTPQPAKPKSKTS